jgi:hypothetical protein
VIRAVAQLEFSTGGRSGWARGGGLIALGLFVTLFGAAATNACLSSGGPGCGVALVFALLGIVLILVGFTVVLLGGRARPALGYNPAVPPPLMPIGGGPPGTSGQIRCRYCGSVSDASLPHCPNCGAPR